MKKNEREKLREWAKMQSANMCDVTVRLCNYVDRLEESLKWIGEQKSNSCSYCYECVVCSNGSGRLIKEARQVLAEGDQ